MAHEQLEPLSLCFFHRPIRVLIREEVADFLSKVRITRCLMVAQFFHHIVSNCTTGKENDTKYHSLIQKYTVLGKKLSQISLSSTNSIWSRSYGIESAL